MTEFNPSEFDARKWARHWMEVIAECPGVPQDEETMVGWFANALLAGYDKARQEQEQARARPYMETFPARNMVQASFGEPLPHPEVGL